MAKIDPHAGTNLAKVHPWAMTNAQVNEKLIKRIEAGDKRVKLLVEPGEDVQVPTVKLRLHIVLQKKFDEFKRLVAQLKGSGGKSMGSGFVQPRKSAPLEVPRTVGGMSSGLQVMMDTGASCSWPPIQGGGSQGLQVKPRSPRNVAMASLPMHASKEPSIDTTHLYSYYELLTDKVLEMLYSLSNR